MTRGGRGGTTNDEGKTPIVKLMMERAGVIPGCSDYYPLVRAWLRERVGSGGEWRGAKVEGARNENRERHVS